ncbi:MAG: PAS domain-containing protein [Deltaproteobacteria bacterium]|nr:PAS domain-containing protein [Deltaproteobacteria bacterium]
MTSVSEHSIRTKLLGLMVLRVVLAIAFLIVGTWFQVSGHSFTQPIYYPMHVVVVVVGLLSIIYALLLNKIKNLGLFAFFQLSADVALVTVIVFVTGATESYLSVLYLFVVIGGGILLGSRGGYYTAVISCLAYGLLLDLDYYGVLPAKYKVFSSVVDPTSEDVLTTLAINILAFCTVAYLGGYLAKKTETIERALEERDIDYGRLEALNRHIVDNITSGIITLDARFRITSFNQAASTITGFSLREVYYGDINFVFPDLFDTHLNKDNLVGDFERVYSFKDSEGLCLGFSITKGEGGDMEMIVIFQNMTEIKALEEQLRRDDKLKALGELSASLAHEVRNPLASMSGSIQLLGQELELDGEKKRLMEIVLKESERLNALITDFLVFARPAKGQSERFSLGGIINETLDIFENSPEAQLITIEDSVRAGLVVEGDKRQLSQVFWNLFLNAASAMPSGGVLKVTSSLGTQSRPRAGGTKDRYDVLIEITDNGEGMAEDVASKIFDPFFSTKENGTGLGLVLAHRIIKEHDGSITLKSTLGKGTTFSVSLPLAVERSLH